MTSSLHADAVFSLVGKTALVTGASSGLGRSFATTLAAYGANVVLAARRVERLKSLAEEIKTQTARVPGGGKTLVVQMDVTSPKSVSDALSETVSTFGGLDILVNNAGVVNAGPLIEATDKDWRQVMDVNLDAAFRVVRDSARVMRDGTGENSGGSIINIASLLSFEVKAGIGAYATTKAALMQMSRAMAVEFAIDNIRVNSIAPGFFQSEMTDDFLGSERGQNMLRGLPHKRAGNPEELDGALLLLASGAGGYMTGTTLLVDGGHSLMMP